MTVPVALPPKKAMMLALLERSSVFIYLDPRAEQVRVPPWFKKQPQLVLQVGLNMAVRIPDLAVEDEAVSCTLSFSRSPFFCYVPFTSVFALFGEDGKGMVWPSDVPKEVAAQQAEEAAKQARLGEKPRLGAVQADPEPPQQEPEAEKGLRRAKGQSKGQKRAAKAPRAGGDSRPRATTGDGKSRTKRAGASAKTAATKAAPAAGSSPASPIRESKRPLPPYLRVVK